MLPKGSVLILLFSANIIVNASEETADDPKIGVILDNDIDEESLRQTVDKLTEHYRPWLPQSRISTVWRSLNSSKSQVTKTVCRLLSTGIQALITALKCPQLKSVSVMAEQFKIPHVSVSLEPCPYLSRDVGQFTIHMTAQRQNGYKVLSEIVLFSGCKSVTLLFDKSVDKRYRQDLVLELSKGGIESVVNTYSSMGSTRHYRLEATDIGILCADNLWTILTSDLVVTLNTTFSPYNSKNILLVKAKPRNVSELFLFSGAPCILPDDTIPPFEFGVYKALILCRFAVHTMFIKNRTIFNTGNYPVSHIQTVNASIQIIKQFRQLSGKPESPYIPTEYDLYGIQANSDRLVHVGEWTTRNELTIWDNTVFLSSFVDFGNSVIRIGVPSDTKPFVSWDKASDSYKGLIIDIVEDLAKTLRFSYTFIQAPDGLYGHRLSNGSWTGLIGMVARREVEFATYFTVTPQRSEVVDFTTPFMQDSLAILTPKPKEIVGLFQIFKPFSVDTWLTFVASLLTAAIVFITISIVTFSSTGQEKTMWNHVKEKLFLLIGLSLQQGPTVSPRSISVSCFLSFWLVFSVLMINMYTAVLVAVLTVSTPLKPINSLQDLLDKPDMKVLVHYGTSMWSLFSESSNPIYREVGKRMEKYKESIDPVRTGEYSFVSSRSYLEHIAMTSCEDVRVADERFQSYSLAFAVPKYSFYKEAMDSSIQKMVESGVIVKLTREWYSPTGNCSGHPTKTEARVLTLDRVGGVFIVYIGLCIVACSGLLCEFICCKHCPHFSSRGRRFRHDIY